MDTTDITKLIESLGDWQTWVVVPIIALLAGALGGWAKRLTSTPEDRTRVLGYLVVGAVASLAVLFVLTPSDGVKLLAQSLAAGYAGKAILDALGEKVKTALARRETAEAKEKGKEAVETGNKAVKKAQDLADVLERTLTKGEPAEKTHEILRTSLPEDTTKILTGLRNDLERLEREFNR